MKEKLELFVKDYVKKYNENPNVKSKWEEPVFAYADTSDPLFAELKTIIGDYHKLPSDIMADGKTVITYFIPLDKSIADSNVPYYYASEEWVFGYFDTIDLINGINEGLETLFEENNYKIKGEVI